MATHTHTAQITSRSFLPGDTASLHTSIDSAGRVVSRLTEEERSFFEGRCSVDGFRSYGDLSHHMRTNRAGFWR
jgi:hypothetical protein